MTPLAPNSLFRDDEPLSLRGARLRVHDITRQLELLKLPGQTHTYVEHPLTIASQTDPAISLAITRSIKAAAVMQVDSEGRRTSTKRLYLDSSMLQQHLRSIRDGRASAFASERAAEVTIFVLSLDTPHPLFVVRCGVLSLASQFSPHYAGHALSSRVPVRYGRCCAEYVSTSCVVEFRERFATFSVGTFFSVGVSLCLRVAATVQPHCRSGSSLGKPRLLRQDGRVVGPATTLRRHSVSNRAAPLRNFKSHRPNARLLRRYCHGRRREHES